VRYATGEQIEGALQYMGLRPLPADDLTIGFMRIMNEVATLPAEIHIQIGRKRLHLGPKQRLRTLEYEGRRLLEELLKGAPEAREFSRLSIPQEELANLSPEQLKQYSLYQYLLRLSQQRAAERKKEEERGN